MATRTAMGIDRASIHMRFRKIYSMMTQTESPLPSNLSMDLTIKLDRNKKVSTAIAMINGGKCSLMINFVRIFID
jgi:hypothetical protein